MSYYGYYPTESIRLCLQFFKGSLKEVAAFTLSISDVRSEEKMMTTVLMEGDLNCVDVLLKLLL